MSDAHTIAGCGRGMQPRRGGACLERFGQAVSNTLPAAADAWTTRMAAMQRGRRRRNRQAPDSPAKAARGAPATADYGSAGAARHNILRQKGYKGRGGKGRTLTAAPCCAAACVSWWLNSSLVLCGRQLIITIQKLENTEFSKSYGLWHFFYAKSGDFLQISAPSEELGTLKVT